MLNYTQLILNLLGKQVLRMQRACVAYQFRIDRPVYYPDRQNETDRINEQLKSQLVTEAQVKKKLPKDYYYKILGVGKMATTQQIKASYYALAKKFHPDASNTPQGRKKFQEISNAYHILTDDTKRLEYDQLGAVKDEQNFLKSVTNSFNMRLATSARSSDVPIPSTREDIMRMSTGEPKLDLSFLEAALGVKKTIDLRFLKKCPTCNGKSPKTVSRTSPELCRKCNGTGQLSKKTPTYTSLLVCDQCQGKRYVNRNTCDTCDNRGFVLETVKAMASVPSGAKSGDVVSIENPKTHDRVGYRLQVADSEYFQRNGNDIVSERWLSISEAVLGGTFKVRGLHDDFDVKVEPGTASHTKVIMHAKGIKSREGNGNHIVTFKVRIPRTLSTKQRQLILALSKTEDPSFQPAT